MAKYQENYYMLQLFDKIGNQIVPFGRINYLVLPRVEQDSQMIHSIGSKNSAYIPCRIYMTDFSAAYEDFERNEGAKKFLAHFSHEPNLNKRFCGSIFSSNPMKMLAYFDDAFVKSMEVKPDFGGLNALGFCFAVNDFEYCDGFIK
jgi:hypothetical protein